MAVYRNPGASGWWGGRSQSLFEVTNWNGRFYTAPASDWYGVVIFNNSPGSPSGSYTARVQEDLYTLASGDCRIGTGVPKVYQFTQPAAYWSCLGVDPSGSDDKDIYLYADADGAGSLLAASTGVSGPDFVLGDFNHTALGTYYGHVRAGTMADPYVVDWEDGPEVFPMGSEALGTMGGGAGNCGLVKAWDLYLQAGTTYRFSVVKNGSADPRASLFRNAGNGTYFAGRPNSAFERSAAQGPMTYTAPATDFYGLVVFNAAAGSPAGDYRVRVQENAVALASGACQSWTTSPRTFSFAQASAHWTVLGVSPGGSDQKSLAVWSDPDGVNAALGASSLAGVNFVAGDFTHLAASTYYGNVSGGATSAAYIVEWEDGADVLAPGTPVNGAMQGGADCGAFRAWDLSLESGKTYQFTLTKTGTADVRLALLGSTASQRWVGRSGALLEAIAGGSPATFEAPATDVYGVVVFNAVPGNPTGTFTLTVTEVVAPPDLMVEQVEVTPATPNVAEPTLVRALVRNIGTGAAPASLTGYALNGTNQAPMATPALAAGANGWSAWLSLGLLPQGGYSGLACADFNAAIPELDEFNNCMRHEFTVQSGSGVEEVVGRSGIMVPNPYRPGAPILLSVRAGDARVAVRIYSVRGQLLRTLYDGVPGTGSHSLPWDGFSDEGTRLHAGVYFLRAQIGGLEVRKTLQLLK
jgi:hypothetical protein